MYIFLRATAHILKFVEFIYLCFLASFLANFLESFSDFSLFLSFPAKSFFAVFSILGFFSLFSAVNT